MPIKGITGVIRLPRLGKIRLGLQRESSEGFSYPVPTDYFVCPDEVKKVFGQCPTELSVMLPTENPNQWASQYLRCYSAYRGLICRGDGETAVARVNTKTGQVATHEDAETELREIACSPKSCHHYETGRCKRVMNLQFLIPDCPGIGVYQLDTGSYHSILNVNNSLDLIKSACGRLSMIPLSLRLIEKEVDIEGRKKTVRVLLLTSHSTLAEIQKLAQMPPSEVLLLPPPDSAVPDDLFPEEAININKENIRLEDGATERDLIRLWDKAKSKVWQLDIREHQLRQWFSKHCNIDVEIRDFNWPLPPAKFTAEGLNRFLKAVDRDTAC
ncbi:hypothetical protein Dform_01945 [Dehalogenimonas formicexedens]|uniref:Uncharacterized protein n=2 Tax=Dehalogenimonas TaxID=670486 RepID=A0A1P8F9X1_9CHLR|nr:MULTISPECIES: hypothetical protein [Dehalogenimonas]APV45259.1 hypothetical protein Dform_01945 [Dehalogenimonas formicexedens]KTB49072.1 hypothetical protein DEALK_19210 [Dehalogenimonas alkenigignens]